MTCCEHAQTCSTETRVIGEDAYVSIINIWTRRSTVRSASRYMCVCVNWKVENTIPGRRSCTHRTRNAEQSLSAIWHTHYYRKLCWNLLFLSRCCGSTACHVAYTYYNVRNVRTHQKHVRDTLIINNCNGLPRIWGEKNRRYNIRVRNNNCTLHHFPRTMYVVGRARGSVEEKNIVHYDIMLSEW